MALHPRRHIAALQQVEANNWVHPPHEGDSCKDPNPEVIAAFPQLAEIM